MFEEQSKRMVMELDLDYTGCPGKGGTNSKFGYNRMLLRKMLNEENVGYF